MNSGPTRKQRRKQTNTYTCGELYVNILSVTANVTHIRQTVWVIDRLQVNLTQGLVWVMAPIDQGRLELNVKRQESGWTELMKQSTADSDKSADMNPVSLSSQGLNLPGSYTK